MWRVVGRVVEHIVGPVWWGVVALRGDVGLGSIITGSVGTLMCGRQCTRTDR